MKTNITDRKLLLPLTLLLCLGYHANANAGSMYKWVDSNGQVHYSQSKPTDTTDTEQLRYKSESHYGDSDEETKKEKEKTPAVSEQTAQLIEARKKNCEISRQNMDIYRYSDKIQQPDGKVITLSEEMREQKLKETQAQVDNYCK